MPNFEKLFKFSVKDSNTLLNTACCFFDRKPKFLLFLVIWQPSLIIHLSVDLLFLYFVFTFVILLDSFEVPK